MQVALSPSACWPDESFVLWPGADKDSLDSRAIEPKTIFVEAGADHHASDSSQIVLVEGHRDCGDAEAGQTGSWPALRHLNMAACSRMIFPIARACEFSPDELMGRFSLESRFPQYLITAMLVGALKVAMTYGSPEASFPLVAVVLPDSKDDAAMLLLPNAAIASLLKPLRVLRGASLTASACDRIPFHQTPKSGAEPLNARKLMAGSRSTRFRVSAAAALPGQASAKHHALDSSTRQTPVLGNQV